MFKNIVLQILFIFCSRLLFASETPNVINFSKSYYNAQSQNWSIDQTKDGLMVFANSGGLLIFDGSHWDLHRLPNGQIMRTVATDEKGRIFCGGFEEFGMWEEGLDGQLFYTSISDSLPRDQMNNTEIWNILVTRRFVIFQSFSKMYKYDFNKVEQLPSPSSDIMYIHDIDGRLIVQALNKGIYELKSDNSYQELPNMSLFIGKKVSFILPYRHKGLLIGTEHSGIYRYMDGELSVWNQKSNQYFIDNQLNKGLKLSNGTYAFGTILNGLYVLNSDGDLIYNVNKENGLQNNTILSLTEDFAYNLWLGLDVGIDLIELNAPLVYYQDQAGKIGTVYTAILFENKLFIGTNHGLFVKQWNKEFGGSTNNATFKLIKNTKGHVWDLKVINNELFCGHNSGTFVIKEDEAIQIMDVGSWMVAEYPFAKDIILIASYWGCRVIKKNNQGTWVYSHQVSDINASIRKIAFDNDGYTWVTSPYKGLWRFKPDSVSILNFEFREFTLEDGLESEYNINLTKLEDFLIINSGSLMLHFSAADDTLVVIDAVKERTFRGNSFKLIKGLNREWFEVYDDHILLTEGSEAERIDLKLVDNYENIIGLDQSHYLFCLEEGYALYDRNSFNFYKNNYQPKPVFYQINLFSKTGKPWVIYKPMSNKEYVIKMPNQNNIRFYFSIPIYNKEFLFQYKLVGFSDEWSPWTSSNFKEYTNLKPNEYEFHVRSNMSPNSTSFKFQVTPKWHQTLWAKIFYIFILIFVVTLLRLYHKQRLRNEKRKLELDNERKLHQQRIETENHVLQIKIDNKNKELANSTISLIRKNEILIKIKEELNTIKEEIGVRLPDKHHKHLLKIIDKNITSEHDWLVFEDNFNEAHNNFFKKLKTDFPNLSIGDLKLAAYLKMNLSSKEIAQLLNISTRGVENKRYRLRKGMTLNPDDNLTEFIIVNY